jgi:hypothetical protein
VCLGSSWAAADVDFFFIPQSIIPHASGTQAIAGSQDRAGTKPEAGSMEGDGKTRVAPPCRDNNQNGTQKITPLERAGGKEKEEEENVDAKSRYAS